MAKKVRNDVEGQCKYRSCELKSLARQKSQWENCQVTETNTGGDAAKAFSLGVSLDTRG